MCVRDDIEGTTFGKKILQKSHHNRGSSTPLKGNVWGEDKRIVSFRPFLVIAERKRVRHGFIRLRGKPRPSGRGGIARHVSRALLPHLLSRLLSLRSRSHRYAE